MNEQIGKFDIYFVDGSSIKVYGNLYAIDRERLFKRSSGEIITELNFDGVLYIIKKWRRKR